MRRYKADYLNTYGAYTPEIQSGDVNMNLSVNYSAGNSRIVSKYGGADVMYANSTEKNKRAFFDWGSGKEGRLRGSFKSYGTDEGMYAMVTNQREKWDAVIWAFPNRNTYNSTKGKLDKLLLNNRKW